MKSIEVTKRLYLTKFTRDTITLINQTFDTILVTSLEFS